MNTEDVKKLADLSRLELTDDQVREYQKDFEGILGYIDTLQSVDIGDVSQAFYGANTNYLRDDEQSYQTGEFSEDLLDAAPARDGDFIKVQKIL